MVSYGSGCTVNIFLKLLAISQIRKSKMTQYIPLSQRSLSLDHQELIRVLTETKNILIIQDLDGVCMRLVKDPLTREIDRQYLEATKSFNNHFFVLTNGEHIGKRGVNCIVEKAFADKVLVNKEGLYLPGLAGGGVQWQDRHGNVSHLGVSDLELAFLAAVPNQIEATFKNFFQQDYYGLNQDQIEEYTRASILDNKVTPTANLNVFYDVFQDQLAIYAQLQQIIKKLLDELLQEADRKGLKNSFFVHYAPNLGRDNTGKEIMQPAQAKDSGTTDFQFMLRGAIKEVGVLVILNYYYFLQTGTYPLGENFNARQAPHNHQELLTLVRENFDPKIMPQIIGVGDTVTSKAEVNGDSLIFRRGGSDRGFLQLVQDIGREFNTENIVAYIDSSAGEVKNRKPLKMEKFTDNHKGIAREKLRVIEGPGDYRDNSDPLTLNVVFPEGYQQYIKLFQEAALRK